MNMLMRCRGSECVAVCLDVEVSFGMLVAMRDVAGVVCVICFDVAVCNVTGIV